MSQNKILNKEELYFINPAYYPLFTLVIFIFFLFAACKKPDIKPEKDPTLTISPSSLTIAKNVGAGHSLIVTVENSKSEAVQIKWSSANTKIATVNDQGFVTGMAAGETEVTATLINGKGIAKCKVTVYDENDYKFRLVLKDKGTSPFSVNRPEEFLSPKALERRKKRSIMVDASDLPISPDYIKEIEKVGGVVVAQSKWLNTVSVHCTDEFLIDKYQALPFVKEVVVVWQGKKASVKSIQNAGKNILSTTAPMNAVKNSTDYAAAWDNINLNKGHVLHEQGYKGAGIDIAVIDAGFSGLKSNSTLSNINIKGAKSFIYGKTDPYETDDSHGVWVTSCMAANKPGYYVGTAPEANYWLLRTEDKSSEYPIEEDYWVAAIEFADSAGVDVVNSSLYYTSYDGLRGSYKYEDMDGRTAMASRGANAAVSKGIFIVSCAGNNRSWIGTPGDSPDVLTVGSVDRAGVIDYFTSWGITIDGRMKPDVVALGGGATVIDTDGTAKMKSGTSYASPTICGLAACLWQAYPKLSNKQLLDVIRKSANTYNNPLLPYGSGVPDMQKAMQLAQAL